MCHSHQIFCQSPATKIIIIIIKGTKRKGKIDEDYEDDAWWNFDIMVLKIRNLVTMVE